MLSDDKDETNVGNFKMFEFVRIRNNKSKKIKLFSPSTLVPLSGIIPSFLSSDENRSIETLGSMEIPNEPIEQREEQPQADQRIEPGVPKKRSGHRAVCCDEYLWIWGGFSPGDDDNEINELQSPILPELWRFNLTTRKWTLLKTTGEAPKKTVASHSVALFGKNLIVFGGTGCRDLSDKLYICNLNTFEWKKYELKGTKPKPLYGSTINLVGHNLYVLFGTNAQKYCSNVYKINLDTLQSEKLFDSLEMIDNVANYRELVSLNQEYPNDFLKGRYRQETIFYNDKIYAFGGGNKDGDSYSFDLLPAFDINTNKWEFILTQPDSTTKTYPEKRKFHSAIKVENYVYIFGGMYSDIENFRPVENSVWRLDMSHLKWLQLNIEMPVLTYFHASCVNSNGQVYIHGGVKATERLNQTRINHLYTILLKIPKLTDICWTKLVTNYPKLIDLDKEKLIEIGVPFNFVKRII